MCLMRGRTNKIVDMLKVNNHFDQKRHKKPITINKKKTRYERSSREVTTTDP